FIAGLFYTVQSTVDLETEDKDGNPNLIEFNELDYWLINEEAGMEEGNRMYFTAGLETNLYHLAPNDFGAISSDFYSADQLAQSSFIYILAADPYPAHAKLGD